MINCGATIKNLWPSPLLTVNLWLVPLPTKTCATFSFQVEYQLTNLILNLHLLRLSVFTIFASVAAYTQIAIIDYQLSNCTPPQSHSPTITFTLTFQCCSLHQRWRLWTSIWTPVDLQFQSTPRSPNLQLHQCYEHWPLIVNLHSFCPFLPTFNLHHCPNVAIYANVGRYSS